jgi:hypothetical protein
VLKLVKSHNGKDQRLPLVLPPHLLSHAQEPPIVPIFNLNILVLISYVENDGGFQLVMVEIVVFKSENVWVSV